MLWVTEVLQFTKRWKLLSSYSLNQNLRNEGIASVMPYYRLMQIWRYLKITNIHGNGAYKRRGEPGYDPKYWFKEFYCALLDRLKSLFVTSGFVVMDEYLQRGAHRAPYRRFIPEKPGKAGFLWYEMAGYRHFYDGAGKVIKGATLYIPLFFGLYTADEPWRKQPGPRGGPGLPPKEYRGFGEGGCFLLDFLSKLFAAGVVKTGATIIGDRLFSSIKLLWLLGRLGFSYIGTAKKTAKGVPEFPSLKAAPRGTCHFKTVTNIKGLAIGVWKDSTEVLFMTMGYVQRFQNVIERNSDIVEI